MGNKPCPQHHKIPLPRAPPRFASVQGIKMYRVWPIKEEGAPQMAGEDIRAARTRAHPRAMGTIVGQPMEADLRRDSQRQVASIGAHRPLSLDSIALRAEVRRELELIEGETDDNAFPNLPYGFGEATDVVPGSTGQCPASRAREAVGAEHREHRLPATRGHGGGGQGRHMDADGRRSYRPGPPNRAMHQPPQQGSSRRASKVAYRAEAAKQAGPPPSGASTPTGYVSAPPGKVPTPRAPPLAPPAEAPYFKEVRCGACFRQGHDVSKCAFPTIAGDVAGCPICNANGHIYDDCPRKQGSELEKFVFLYWKRSDLPPLRCRSANHFAAAVMYFRGLREEGRAIPDVVL